MSLTPRSTALLVLIGLLGGCDRFMPGDDAGEAAGTGEGSAPIAAPADVPEAEPNDTADTATSLSLATWYAGAATTGNADNVAFLAAGAYTLTVESAAPLVVRVEDTQAGQWVEQTITGGTLTLTQSARQSRIGVTIEGEGAWRLRVDAAATACGFAAETDSLEAPGVFVRSVPSSASGCLQTPDDVDYVRIPGEAITAAGAFGVSVTGVPGVSLEVKANDAAGNPLVDLVGGPGQDVRVPNLGAPVGGGDVTLAIRSLGGASQTDAWQLEVTRLPTVVGILEIEPNDLATQPSMIDQVAVVHGFLHRPGDVDHYVIQPAEPRVVRLRADAPDDVDLQLFIDEGVLYGPTTIDDVGVGEEEALCSLLVGPDRPFPFGVRARSVSPAITEPYLLHFELYDGLDFEIEPNNTVDTIPPSAAPDQAVATVALSTGSQRVGSGVSGHLFPLGDIDVFAVDVFGDPTAAATFSSVTLRLEPNAPNDYTIELVDSDGGLVARGDRGLRGEAEMVSLDLPAGRYFVRVTMGAGDPCVQPYRLSVGQTEIPPTPVPVPIAEGSGVPAEGSAAEPADAEDGEDDGIRELRLDVPLRPIETGPTRLSPRPLPR